MVLSLNTQAKIQIASYCRDNHLHITEAVRENWIAQWVECSERKDFTALEILMEENRREALHGGEIIAERYRTKPIVQGDFIHPVPPMDARFTSLLPF